MGGIDAQRGFIYQSIVAIIECLEKTGWDAVKIEPHSELDKIDILLYEEEKEIEAIQVKSSKNAFERSAVRVWLESLKADAPENGEICLYLVGDSFTPSCEDYIRKNKEIKIISFDYLEDICLGKLHKYIEENGWAKNLCLQDLELIDASIFYKIHKNSINSKPLIRSAFNEAFIRALPIHGIPQIVSNALPMKPEVGLIGRNCIVQQIRHLLDMQERFVLISGIGGIGKSAIMKQISNDIFSEEKEDCHIAWINCSGNLNEDLLVLREGFKIPKSYSREDALNFIIKELKSMNGNLYLFLDNMDYSRQDYELLNALRKQVYIVATARQSVKGFSCIAVDALEENDAIELFYAYYELDRNRQYIDEVRKIINDYSVNSHTLLIELLAKAAGTFWGTLVDFRKKLEERGYLGVSQIKFDTGRFDNTTIQDCVVKLYDTFELNEVEKRIMNLFTLFSPDVNICGFIVEWVNFDENEVNNLVKRGWLNKTGDGFSIHQIIKDSITTQRQNRNERVVLEEYGDLLSKIAEIESYIPLDLEFSKARERMTIAIDIEKYLKKLMKEMLLNESLSDTDLHKFDSYTTIELNIGLMLYERGESKIAMDYFKDALFFRTQVFGFDNIGVANVYNNMGLALMDLFDYNNAFFVFKKAQPIYEREYGAKHERVSALYNNLAMLCSKNNDYTQALEYGSKALSIIEDTSGHYTVSTAKAYNTVGEIINSLHDFDKALRYEETARDIFETVLGSEHPNTALVYSGIGVLYSEKKEYEKAAEYFMKAMGIMERVLGTEHRETAILYCNISDMYYDQGDYSKAIEYSTKALFIYNKKYGPAHPYTDYEQFHIKEMKDKMNESNNCSMRTIGKNEKQL